MRVWIRSQIGWLLTLVLTASALAQTTVPANQPQRQPATEQEAKATGGPGPDAAANSSQSQNSASQNKPPATVNKKGGKAKWIVIGAVAGTAVVIGAIFAARLNNEGYF